MEESRCHVAAPASMMVLAGAKVGERPKNRLSVRAYMFWRHDGMEENSVVRIQPLDMRR